MNIIRTVNSFLNTGIYTPIGKYKLANNADGSVAKIEIGTLVGFNENDELINVETTANKAVRAVGVITDGSVVTVDDPRYLPNGKNYKESWDFQELYRQFKIMGVTNLDGVTGTKWTKKDIGTVVYLSEGKLTITKPTTGVLGQKIGTLGDPTRREILCCLKDDMRAY